MMPECTDFDQIKMAQRAQRKLAQGFQMYVYFVATGAKIDEALTKMDAAMEAWTDYEDAHNIEMPQQFGLEQVLQKFGAMAEQLGKRSQEPEPPNSESSTAQQQKD